MGGASVAVRAERAQSLKAAGQKKDLAVGSKTM
jgi:hypothetical protein